MSEYLDIARADAVAEGEMLEVTIEDHAFLVARVDGQIHVADARCPHLHAHLVRGTLEGVVVTCPWHGSQFDIRDGRAIRWTEFEGVVKTVAQLARHPRPLRVYDSVVEDGMIRVGKEKDPVEA